MKYVILTQGAHAIVDNEDFLHVSQFKYQCRRNGRYGRPYACRSKKFMGKVRVVPLQNDVLGLIPSRSVVVDHINHNPLDCRRANLRICTATHNMWNKTPSRFKNKVKTSKYKGVHYNPSRLPRPWQATIMAHRKKHHLGHFADEYSAVQAYNAAAKKYHKSFACPNLWTGPTHPKQYFPHIAEGI